MTPRAERLDRAFDVLVPSGVLLSSMPIQAGIGIRRSMGSPMPFRQTRFGKNGVIFEFLKSRTTRHADAAHVNDTQRLTDLSRVLCSTSLEALPTVWNVVNGDTNLVGSRPLLVEYLSLYTTEQPRRHKVRLGVTGLHAGPGAQCTAMGREIRPRRPGCGDEVPVGLIRPFWAEQ